MTQKTAPVEQTASSSSDDETPPTEDFHYATRGEVLSNDEAINGFDAERMRDRTLLTAEEEKKLLRRIDWHLMPLCSIIFMFKNLDSDNVRYECQNIKIQKTNKDNV